MNAEECLADFIGKIHERNACRAPWINTFDLQLNVGLPFKRVKAEITWDILNLINLFDSQTAACSSTPTSTTCWWSVRSSADDRPITYNLQNLFILNGVRADAGGAVHAQRPALALADAVRSG